MRVDYFYRIKKMARIYNSGLKPNARKLRRDMTEEERKLWYCFLKTLPLTIYRQRVIGKYIADFYCSNPKIVIELDGSQHYEDESVAKDEIRDEYFKELGITVLRYSNLEVTQNFKNVCNDIAKHLNLLF